jgi:hypothetical protein
LKRLQQARDALLQVLLDKPSPPLPLGDDHLDDLTTPCDEIGEKPSLFITKPWTPKLNPKRRSRQGDKLN